MIKSENIIPNMARFMFYDSIDKMNMDSMMARFSLVKCSHDTMKTKQNETNEDEISTMVASDKPTANIHDFFFFFQHLYDVFCVIVK